MKPCLLLLALLLAGLSSSEATPKKKVTWVPVKKNSCAQTCAERGLVPIAGGSPGYEACRYRSQVGGEGFWHVGTLFGSGAARGCYYYDFPEGQCPMPRGYQCGCQPRLRARQAKWVPIDQAAAGCAVQASHKLGPSVEVAEGVCRVKVEGGKYLVGSHSPYMQQCSFYPTAEASTNGWCSSRVLADDWGGFDILCEKLAKPA